MQLNVSARPLANETLEFFKLIFIAWFAKISEKDVQLLLASVLVLSEDKFNVAFMLLVQ